MFSNAPCALKVIGAKVARPRGAVELAVALRHAPSWLIRAGGESGVGDEHHTRQDGSEAERSCVQGEVDFPTGSTWDKSERALSTSAQASAIFRPLAGPEKRPRMAPSRPSTRMFATSFW